ncbi:MAG TPA: AMP-binding protein [Steroidobacteraceae bacterium]|jgi:acyl-CoA synthetase (AMP-forming)/AMP-acid ligase II
MRTVRELIERNARYFPNREAYVCGERRLTHATYAERAFRLASGLYGLGLRGQDRIAILAMNCLEFYETYAAAEVGGYIAAPVNYRLAAPEIAYLLRDSAAKILIFEAPYTAVVESLRGEVHEIQQYVCIGGDPTECPAWALAFEEVVTRGSPDGPPISPQPDDYVYLWYTSGTTGKPKGVAWRHWKACESARANALITEFTGDSRVLQVTPAFHIGGKGYVVGASWVGGCTVFHRAFDPVAMLATIDKERITMTFMVAAMLQAILAAPNLHSYNLSSLRMIVTAAAPIPVPVLRRSIELLGPIFSIQYGCTEVGGISALPRWEVNPYGTEADIRRLASVGHIPPEVDSRLVNEQGESCGPGVPGEVVMRSRAMFDGYWNNSPATVEAIRDGWYHTGDIGVLDEEGYLFLVDRKKDMIISGGENIYSREVEEALASHTDVVDVAVIGVPHPKWVEAVKAVVVIRKDASLTEAELIAHCKTRIAGYKCPKSVEFVADLPRLATGKLDKPGLRARHRI